MADKGLISKNTLTAIADAIRAKTETSDTMLPEEMAARIAAIKTQSPLSLTKGTFYQSSNSNTTSLETTIDISGDYYLLISIVGDGSLASNINYIKKICQSKIDGVITTEVEYSSNTTIMTSSDIAITVASDGTITCGTTNFRFDGGDNYDWTFICPASS